jgi:acetolactate synthase-1/2/3 large subunit
MNTKSFSPSRNRAKKLKSDTNSEFTPVQTTHINKRYEHSIILPSESSLIPSPLTDVQPNPQLDIASLKRSLQLAPVSVAEAIAKMLGYMGVQYAFGVSGGAIAPL